MIRARSRCSRTDTGVGWSPGATSTTAFGSVADCWEGILVEVADVVDRAAGPRGEAERPVEGDLVVGVVEEFGVTVVPADVDRDLFQVWVVDGLHQVDVAREAPRGTYILSKRTKQFV